MKKPPLLITATFDAGRTPQVALSRTEDRVEKHMQGFLAWLKDPFFSHIVFVKNCSVKIHAEILREAAFSYGKELEFIQVTSTPRTILQGKGYGEGNLIRKALEKSEFLWQSDDFFKITGKLYSPGVQSLFTREGIGEFFLSFPPETCEIGLLRKLFSPLYQSEGGSALLGLLRRGCRVPWGMIAAIPSGWIDTRFYRVNRNFYLKALRRSHRRVQDQLGYTLEAAIHDDLKAHPSVRMIQQPPIILGTSGTLGTTAGEYTAELREEARKLAERLTA